MIVEEEENWNLSTEENEKKKKKKRPYLDQSLSVNVFLFFNNNIGYNGTFQGGSSEILEFNGSEHSKIEIKSSI